MLAVAEEPGHPTSTEASGASEASGAVRTCGQADPQQLGSALLQWFAVHRRDLPWRVGRNPYRIWVSEVMLQQTRVETVVPYYERFLQAFPTVEALASASEADVVKLWEGLGYYSRARNLHKAAQTVVERFGGELPGTVAELRTLPGIGRYTAGAIASIAHNEPVAAVDGNVLRVIARLLGITDVITRAAVQRRIEEQVVAMIPPGEAASMTEALMELGALVCVPRTPVCEQCPWQTQCVAKAAGIAADLPKRPERTRARIVTGAVAVVTKGDTVLVTQRPDEGLLAGMWEFPWVETGTGDGGGQRQRDAEPGDVEAQEDLLRDALRERYGIDVRVVGQLPSVRHVFSHLEWHLNVFQCEILSEQPQPTRSGDRVPMARVEPSQEPPGVAETRHSWPEEPPRYASRYASSYASRYAEDDDGSSADKGQWITKVRLQQLPFGRAHRRIANAWLKGVEAPGG